MYLYGGTKGCECLSTWIVSTRGGVLSMSMLRKSKEHDSRQNLFLVCSSAMMTLPPLRFWGSCQVCLSSTALMVTTTTMISRADPWEAGHGMSPIRTTTPILVPRTYGLAHRPEWSHRGFPCSPVQWVRHRMIPSPNLQSHVLYPSSLFQTHPIRVRRQDRDRIWISHCMTVKEFEGQSGRGVPHQRHCSKLQRRQTMQRQ